MMRCQVVPSLKARLSVQTVNMCLLAGFLIIFLLLFLDKSSSVLLFLAGRLVGTSVCFLHDCHIMATVVLLAAGGGEELLFRVVVKRVLMMQ